MLQKSSLFAAFVCMFAGLAATLPPQALDLRNEAAIATALGAVWSLKLANILEYDNSPTSRTKSTDSNSLLGLQYAF